MRSSQRARCSSQAMLAQPILKFEWVTNLDQLSHVVQRTSVCSVWTEVVRSKKLEPLVSSSALRRVAQVARSRNSRSSNRSLETCMSRTEKLGRPSNCAEVCRGLSIYRALSSFVKLCQDCQALSSYRALSNFDRALSSFVELCQALVDLWSSSVELSGALSSFGRALSSFVVLCTLLRSLVLS